MKKVFQLRDKKKHEDRVLEAIKNDIKKYIKREKNKKLPESTMYYDFDCKIGARADDAKFVRVVEINKALDAVKASDSRECYVEILAKAISKPLGEKLEVTKE